MKANPCLLKLIGYRHGKSSFLTPLLTFFTPLLKSSLLFLCYMQWYSLNNLFFNFHSCQARFTPPPSCLPSLLLLLASMHPVTMTPGFSLSLLCQQDRKVLLKNQPYIKKQVIPSKDDSRCTSQALFYSRCANQDMHFFRCTSKVLFYSRCTNQAMPYSRCTSKVLFYSRCTNQAMHYSRCTSKVLFYSRCTDQAMHCSRCTSQTHFYSRCTSQALFYSRCTNKALFYPRCTNQVLFYSRCTNQALFYSRCTNKALFSSRYVSQIRMCSTEACDIYRQAIQRFYRYFSLNRRLN